MQNGRREGMNDILDKYRNKIEKELGNDSSEKLEYPKKIITREYQEFQKETSSGSTSFYENACNFSEKILKVKPDKKKENVLLEAIETCHLNITPTGATSFALIAPITIALIGSMVSFILLQSVFFVIFFMGIAMAVISPLGNLPIYMANNWRLKASNQMVLCIFYVVTYMRHTSNLEGAIEFAAEHLSPPLSWDLKKVLWGLETGEFESVKHALDSYLTKWKDYSPEFIEAFHLIESSLFEGVEEKRLASLDKSLDLILSETYEKMLHYAHNLQSPINMLHMLGIILPILGLVILPLVVSFLDDVAWYHLSLIYNVAIPISVYIMGRNILSKRPTGYGEMDITKRANMVNADAKKIRFGKNEFSISPKFIAITIGTLIVLAGLSPMIIHMISPDFDISLWDGRFEFIGYRLNKAKTRDIGPFGIGASILSLLVTIGLGYGIGIYNKLKSRNYMDIREQSKKLELEFASALFQLGNRLADGIPAELAVSRVTDTMEGTVSGNFFRLVTINIKRMGMGVSQAIFDPKYGALAYYPSAIIESSMKVLIQSIKKGPEIAANSLMNISRYIKEIHKVDERLNDLMADIISSMNSQIKVLTPIISGIVIGITSMISTILGKLGQQLANSSVDAAEGASGTLMLFGDGLPTFTFQIVVGIYVVQIIFILTILVNGIQNGFDQLNERYLLGKNLPRSVLIYSIMSLVIMLIFNLIAGQIMSSTLSAS